MAEKLLKEAENAVGDKNYEEAVLKISAAIELEPTAYAFSKRARAYLRWRKDAEAAADAKRALELDPDTAEAYLCLGVIHNKENRKDEARVAFTQGVHAYNANPVVNTENIAKQLGMYLLQAGVPPAELAALCPAALGRGPSMQGIDAMRRILEATPAVARGAVGSAAAGAALPAAPATASVSSAAAGAAPIHATASAATLAGTSTAAATAAAVPVPQPAVRKPKYEWYQTPTHVTVSFVVKDADPARSSVVVEEDCRTLAVSLALPASEWVMDLDLYDTVSRGPAGQPEALSIRAMRVEVKLAKAAGAQYTWPTLEASAAPVPPEAVKAKITGTAAPSAVPSSAPVPVPVSVSAATGGPSASGPAAPTYPSSKGKKDWSKLEKELEDEDDKEKQGEEALMKLFRQIYSDADENTRRAMVKSYQTSGGTVLSTNWKEVAGTDYEKTVQPPAGMQAKKWDQ